MKYSHFGARLGGALIAICALAACGGGAQSTGALPQSGAPSSIGQSQAASTSGQTAGTMQDESADPDAGCKSTGKRVSVNPCIVKFDVLHLFPVEVKVKARKRDEIKEVDNCASQGIATITGGDRGYTVTPGLLGGKCKAEFIARVGHREVGSAMLNITHTLL